MKRIALVALSLGVVFTCAAFTKQASAGDGYYGQGGYGGRYAGRYGGRRSYYREPAYRSGYGPGYCPLGSPYRRRPQYYGGIHGGYYGGGIYGSPRLVPRHHYHSHRRRPRIGLYLGF